MFTYLANLLPKCEDGSFSGSPAPLAGSVAVPVGALALRDDFLRSRAAGEHNQLSLEVALTSPGTEL